MKINQILLYISCTLCFTANAQRTISAKLIDSTKQEPVVYASIQFSSKTGVISNDKGEFNLTITRKITSKDSLFIRCLGYEEKRIGLETFTDSIIYLNSKSIDLDEVLITNKNYTIDEIIDKVKAGLTSNYEKDYAKRKLFFRESYYNTIDKNDVIIETSTIPEINQVFIDSILMVVPKNNADHTEILGELYGKVETASPQKIEILKASRLYDKSNEITFENYEKRFNEIFKKHVKRDSYFKIKSGWFGGKTEIDSSLFGDNDADKEQNKTDEFIAAQKEKEAKRKASFLNYRKSTIHRLEHDNFLSEDNDLNFLEKSRRYEFKLLDYAYLNNEFVYTIGFKPKRSEDFEGTMYVNTEDFAVIRVDYKNVKPLRKLSLLGISMKEYLKEGTIIFEKNTNGKYSLKYMDETFGRQVGIKRPIKIIEKNKNVRGRRKQNEVSGKVHFIVTSIEKKELIVFETSPLSEPEFEGFVENAKVTPTYLSKYDPEFWKGYNVIEPNQAIKEFKVITSED